MNKFLGFILVLIALVISSLLFSSDDSAPESSLNANPKNNIPSNDNNIKLTSVERDTVETTIRTISAKMTQLQEETQLLRNQQREYEAQKISPEERERSFQRIVDNRLKSGLSSMSDIFTEKFKSIDSQIKNNNDDIPSGLGFDNFNSGSIPPINNGKNISTNRVYRSVPVDDDNAIITILPVTSVEVSDKKTQKKQKKLTIDGKLIDDEDAKLKKTSESKNEKRPSVPVYTIPQNATLITNSSMTALVGIVPTRGSILDPFRFKVITGNTNIATNAQYIPDGVKNIVWSGIATGNREMSCVRGELHSVTFTFEDGTIITRNSQADKGKNKLGGNLLGYISNRKGNPCIPGKLITNANDYLKDRIIASGFASAAEGVAVTQQTTNISDEGNVQQFFDGNSADFIAAKTLQGSLNELTDYLRERQRGAVDLVFIEGGQDLVVHVETQINIDYQPDGRKLNHASFTKNKLATYNID